MSNARWKKLASFCTSSAVAALSLAAPANADEWGTGTADVGAHPDGGGHNYCFHSNLVDSLQPNVDYVMSHSLWYHTDAAGVFDGNGSCDTSGTGQTDVRWRSEDLPGNTRGSAFCAVFSGSHCDRNDIELDVQELNEGGNDNLDQSKTACHEMGHSVGLMHHNSNDDCMINGERPSSAENWDHFNTHHTDHVNAWF